LRRHRTAFVATAPGLLLSLATLSGCGPIEYINQVGNRAASAVSAARLAQADRYAPYEMTGAEEYLHKAREEAGYAQYQDAIDYGRRAEELATRSRAIAIEKLAQQPSKSSRRTPKSEIEEPVTPREGGASAPSEPAK
jgi:hypothetical protein